MPGSNNRVQFSNGYRLEASAAEEWQLMQSTATDVSYVNNAGSPEGVVPANMGSICNDRTNGNIYFKHTGTGVTGWVLIASGAGAKATKITIFTASGTFNKDPDSQWLKVYLWGGGSGGGSGRRGAAGTNRGGGSGGANSGTGYFETSAAFVGAIETVVVGAGGAGGAAVAVNDTNGNNGTSGGFSQFGNIVTGIDPAVYISTGIGGTNAGDSVGGYGSLVDLHMGINALGSAQGANGVFGTAVVATSVPANGLSGASGSVSTYLTSPGAGGGGGLTNADVVGNGSAGGAITRTDSTYTTILAGGIAGVAGASGGNGVAASTITSGGIIMSGTSGGGGGASKTAIAGSGGNGAIPGGAGGGGGASLNGFNSGAGGNGARGEVWVIEFF